MSVGVCGPFDDGEDDADYDYDRLSVECEALRVECEALRVENRLLWIELQKMWDVIRDVNEALIKLLEEKH